MAEVRPYILYDVTISVCATCLRRVEAKTVLEEGKVFRLKRCPEHGPEKVLIADDEAYYRQCREVFLKPGEMPKRFTTPVRWGCPYDCGLCTDHQQHSCLTLVELTDQCNLRCPVCYADSGPDRPGFRTLREIEGMLDAVVDGEGEPDVVQLSGGEPTIHPDFFAVMDACKARPIKHLMVNTNGVRLAREPEFATRLATYMPGIEVYLQFDSLRADALKDLRGQDLREVRQRALENLEANGISTTLVMVLKKGLNDDEMGDVVRHALAWRCVRGVTFQPIQHAGRTTGYDPARDRLTLTEVRRRLLEQTDVFRPDDVLPVPCHPDSIAMGYALKTGRKTVPLTGLIDTKVLLEGARSTIVYENEGAVRDHVRALFSTATGPARADVRLRDLLCCLPRIATGRLGYDDLFRVIIMDFLDAHSFDVRAAKKTCVHIVHPDGRIIPFDTYNMFYRGALEQEVLAPLREASHA